MNLLIFPHQLYLDHPGLKLRPSRVVLIEDSLFFGDAHFPMQFHKQKIWLHRSTMKRFEERLNEKEIKTLYLEYDAEPDSLKRHLETIRKSLRSSPRKVVVAEPDDFMLKRRLGRFCRQLKIECHFVDNPGFINLPNENHEYRTTKKRWFMADFYKFQRRRLNI